MARLLFRLLQETTTSPSLSQVTSSPALNSDLILILATILCALICLLGLLAVSRCAWLRRSASNSNGNGSDQTPQPSIANKGLKKKVLRSLPKLTYSPDTENFSDCAICLTEFVAGDELRVLPQCNHVFHVSCIDTWLGSHSSCPSCRQILVVARCHKCGGLPGSSGSGSGLGSEPDNRVKQDHDNGPNPSDSLP